MLMQAAPPSYGEAISAAQLTPNFCWKCGQPVNQQTPTEACGSCGARVFCVASPVVTTQPTSKERRNSEVPANQPSSSATTPAATTYNYDLTMIRKIGNRLIIDFEKVSLCPCGTTGLHDSIRDELPHNLKSLGVTQTQWTNWVDDLHRVQKKSPSLGGCLCMFCFPGLIVQSTLCAFVCPTSFDHRLSFLPCFYGDWYKALRLWQNRVNKTLNAKGMHAKLVTYKPHTSALRSAMYNTRVEGKDHNYEMSFLVIALTPGESKKLINESWDHGVNDGCVSGIGRVL